MADRESLDRLRSRPSVRLRRAHVGGLLPEELLEHLEGRGRRDRAAEAAVLDHRADDEPRRVERAEAAPPGRVRRRTAVRAGVGVRLGGSRLAGDRDRIVAEDVRRGAERRVRRVVEPVADGRDRGRVEVELLRRRLVAAEHLRALRRAVRGPGLLDRRDEVRRDELAAVREQRVEARHLQRRPALNCVTANSR